MKPGQRPALLGGTFRKLWIDGTDPHEPPLQQHLYADSTWILRQSLHTDFEAPFLYPFKGEERAFLVDTGAGGGVPVREVVDELVGEDFPLIVAHSHAHRDHVADDAQFFDRPETAVVGHSPERSRASSISTGGHWELQGSPSGAASLR